MKREVYKSAETGEFVSEEYALEHPETTYRTVVEVDEADEEETGEESE